MQKIGLAGFGVVATFFVVSAPFAEPREELGLRLSSLFDRLCESGLRSCINSDPSLSPRVSDDLVGELERVVALLGLEGPGLEAETRDGLFELCEVDPATCSSLVSELGRAGFTDGDGDGVSDLSDACALSSTLRSQAHALLLEQERALLEVFGVQQAAFALLLQGANGTLGAQQLEILGEGIERLYFELLSVANTQVEGRFLFAGNGKPGAPFVLEAGSENQFTPPVRYVGDFERTVFAAGRFGEPREIGLVGGPIFLGDRDGDGVFPDSDLVNVFGIFAEAAAAFRANDRFAVRVALSSLDLAIVQVTDAARENSRTFDSLRRTFVRPEFLGVDAEGCTQVQFCRGIDVSSQRGRWACLRSDFLNDEPLRTFPRNCRLRYSRREGVHCGIDRKNQTRLKPR